VSDWCLNLSLSIDWVFTCNSLTVGDRDTSYLMSEVLRGWHGKQGKLGRGVYDFNYGGFHLLVRWMEDCGGSWSVLSAFLRILELLG